MDKPPIVDELLNYLESQVGGISEPEGDPDRVVRYPPPHAEGFERLRLLALPKFKVVGENDERI